MMMFLSKAFISFFGTIICLMFFAPGCALSHDIVFDKKLDRKSLSQQIRQKIDSIQTIHITLDESYQCNYQSDVARDIHKIFSAAGFQIVKSESTRADAYLTFAIRGTPDGDFYSSKGRNPQFVYAGATLRCSIVIAIQGVNQIKLEFTNSVHSPEQITLYNKPDYVSAPENAPFYFAYKEPKGLYSKYAQIVAFLGGFKSLSQLLMSSWADDASDLMIRLDPVASIPKLADVGLYNPVNHYRQHVLENLIRLGWQAQSMREKCAVEVIRIFASDFTALPNRFVQMQSLGPCAIEALVPLYLNAPRDPYEMLMSIDKKWPKTSGAKKWHSFIVSCLESEDSQCRNTAIKTLGKMDDARVIPKLIQIYPQEDLTNKTAIAWALGSLHDTTAVPFLLQIVDEKPDELREVVIQQLGWLGDMRAVNKLESLLSDENNTIRGYAMVSLGRIHAPSSLPLLINLLGKSLSTYHSKLDIRDAVLAYGDSVFEPVVQALDNPSKDIREGAASILGELGDGRASPMLLKAMKEGNSMADESLIKLGTKALDVLLADLAAGQNHPDVIKVVGLIKEARAIPSLTLLLKKSLPAVRKEACIALGEIKDRRAVTSIIPCLKDINPDVRLAAAAALGEIGDPAAASPLCLLLKENSPNMRATAALELAKIGDPSSIDPIITAFNSEKDGRFRRFYIEALGHFQSEKVMNVLLSSLEDRDIEVAKSAATGLGNGCDPRAIQGLIKVLKREGRQWAELKGQAALSLVKSNAANDADALMTLVDLAATDTGFDFHRAAAQVSALLAEEGVVRSIPVMLKFYGAIIPTIDPWKNDTWRRMDYEPLVKQISDALYLMQTKTIGDTLAIFCFIDGLGDHRTSEIVSELLKKYGRSVFPQLKSRLAGGNEILKQNVIAFMGENKAIEFLDFIQSRLVPEESCYVLQAAATALGQLGNENTIKVLQDFLNQYRNFLKTQKFVSVCDGDAERACESALLKLKNQSQK